MARRLSGSRVGFQRSGLWGRGWWPVVSVSVVVSVRRTHPHTPHFSLFPRPSFMRAALRVQAGIGDAQPFDRTAAYKMLPHDLFGVFRLHAPVPDGVRVDHHGGPVLALVQAAGFVDAHLRSQPSLAGELLQPRVQLALPVARAGGPWRIGGTRVEADKDVAFEWRQAEGLLGKADIRLTPRRLDSRPSRRFPQPCSHPGPICENECLDMSTDNLLSLKDDMVAFIEGHGMRRLPGYVTEDIPSVLWEDRGNTDAWKDFVEMAKHVGSPFVTFSEMTLDREELDALIEEAGEMNFPDDEAAEMVEAKWLRKYAGMLGYIQLGFVHQGIVFMHETTTEWYERYQALLENLEAFHDIVIDDAHSHDDEDE